MTTNGKLTTFTVIVHPDNHIHDGMKCVVKNLMATAENGQLVLFCEGSVYEPDPTAQRVIRSHDVEWNGAVPFINGVESPTVPGVRLWANATRIAFSTGRDDDKEIRRAGKEGTIAMRSVVVALAALYDKGSDVDRGEIYRLVNDDCIMKFVLEFVERLQDMDVTLPSGEWREYEAYDLADTIAIANGRWPSGEKTFRDLQQMCVGLMPHFQELEEHASVEDSVNHQHVGLRERTIAQNIKSSIKILRENGLYREGMEVHLIIGASHVPQLVNDKTIHALALDKHAFWKQQEEIKSCRLCDMIHCKLTSDIFDPLLKKDAITV